tara:strand:+ start:1858 stop:2304 length:447 start_codon:yes stop_codon:yes gene_type:complete
MPYSDPDKKKQYQDAYNKKYYQDYKNSKNLVSKATNSKTLLRQKKKDYLIKQLGSKCPTCEIRDSTVLLIKSTPQTFIRKWGDASYKSLYDYSWGDLETIWPTLKIVCHVCSEKSKPKHKKALQEMFEEDLPRGYTLDEDLSNPYTKL